MNGSEWEALEEADWQFRRMVRRFVKERDRVTVEGVTLPGMLILHKIIREGEQRLSDLGEQLDFTSGAITALCDKLEAAGYTVRKRQEGDRRTVLLAITPKGREMFERNRNIGTSCITLLFGEYTPEELAAASRGFERIFASLEGFSDKLLALAKKNAEATASPPPPEPEQKRRDTASRYLSY